MNKKDLSERDICSKFITPALVSAKWDLMDELMRWVYALGVRLSATHLLDATLDRALKGEL